MAINFTAGQLAKLKLLTEGGEAKIYEYKNNTLIKIFKPHIDIRRKEAKVNKILSGKMPSNVYGPIEIVTVNNKFAGYVMKKVENAEVFHQLVKGKYLKTYQITNKDVLELMVDSGKTITAFHKSGGLIGDYNDYNIMMKGNKSYFIDVDSWGISAGLTPDAYTEIFMDPNAMRANGSVDFSLEAEHYNFAVLSFNMLTRLHPFGGTYVKDENMTTMDRMKKKISVLGNHKITIPKIIPSWDWMSPQLKAEYQDIFEKGKRQNILGSLEELTDNLEYCKVHKMYYFSKYKECPICNSNAKVAEPPVIVQVTTAKKNIICVVFEAQDVRILLNSSQYVNTNNEVVHIQSKRKVKLERGKMIDFTSDGKFAFVVDSNTITIYDENNKLHSTLERMHKTPYVVKGNYLYFVDRTGTLLKTQVTPNGNIGSNIGQVFNPLFAVSDIGETFVGSFYPKKAIIKINNYNFEVAYKGKIKEYAIKQDSISKKWLFIYQLSNGKYRTMVFGNKVVEYDEEMISYAANPLSNICFYKDTICVPGAGKITMINYVKNLTKEIPCNVVREDSKLNYSNGVFEITNEDKIYQFGG